MSKAKKELPIKAPEKKKGSRISKNSRVDFELSDEELEDVSAGSGSPYCTIPSPRLETR
jgi:hypothetical protein